MSAPNPKSAARCPPPEMATLMPAIAALRSVHFFEGLLAGRWRKDLEKGLPGGKVLGVVSREERHSPLERRDKRRSRHACRRRLSVNSSSRRHECNHRPLGVTLASPELE